MEEARPILVVGGDDVLEALIVPVLAPAGFDTAEAQTGEEALELARTVRPALALVDVYLPGISGYEVCRDLKSEFGPALPVVLVSREARVELDAVAGALLGADECVGTPVDAAEVLGVVRRLLDRAAQPQS